MSWILDRLREPSTWAGLAAIVSGVGALGRIHEAPAIAEIITSYGPMVAGAVAVVAREKW